MPFIKINNALKFAKFATLFFIALFAETGCGKKQPNSDLRSHEDLTNSVNPSVTNSDEKKTSDSTQVKDSIPNQIDPIQKGFGIGGVVGIDHIRVEGLEPIVAIQSDGRMFISGTSNDGANALLMRLQVDGSPDLSFGMQGTVTAKSADVGTFSFCNTIIQPTTNDVILFCYRSKLYNVIAWRFKSDGTLDKSFGQAGEADLGSYPAANLGGAALIIGAQSDGSVILQRPEGAGPGVTKSILFRMLPNGTLDIAFSVTLDVAYGFTSVLIAVDDSIYIAEWEVNQFSLLHYLRTGVLDSSFGVKGSRVVPKDGFRTYGKIVMQKNAKILAKIDLSTLATSDVTLELMQFNLEGSTDTSFGKSGTLALSNSGTSPILASQKDGKILLAYGIFSPNAGRNDPATWILEQRLSEGSPDLKFAESGVAKGPGSQMLTQIISQVDGSILLAGRKFYASLPPALGTLIRFRAEGTLDK